MRLTWIILISALTSLSLISATEVYAPADKQRWWPIHDFSFESGDSTGNCDPKFFEMTAKNLEESESDAFYLDFILKTSRMYPDEYKRLGEVSFFARHAFNGIDVHCSSYKGGCTGIPLCKDILNHMESQNGDRDLARKIYFSMKKIELIVDAIFWFHRILVIIEQNVGLLSDNIAADFTSPRALKTLSASRPRAPSTTHFTFITSLSNHITPNTSLLSKQTGDMVQS